MTPKSGKYVDQKRHNNVSRKHENTRKSMEIPMLYNYFWSLTVYINNPGHMTKIVPIPIMVKTLQKSSFPEPVDGLKKRNYA